MVSKLSAATAAAMISCLLLVATASRTAEAAELKLFTTPAMQSVMSGLIPQFEKSSSHKVTIEYALAVDLADRIQKGEAADVVIAVQQQVSNLEKQGKIVEVTTIDGAKFGIGLFVGKGAPKPKIGSVETFKRTLLDAKSIGYADPTSGAAAAVTVDRLLKGLDIASDIKSKITLFPAGVFDAVANGKVELGFTTIPEIMADPRLELVDPLPAAIQTYIQFAAGIVANSKQQDAGKALIRFVSSPVAADFLKAKGWGAR